MATNNQINVGIATTSGSGSYVGVTSPTLITPVLGVASATSLDFGASSTAGLVGTTTNDAADAGIVGELADSVITVGSAVSLTSTTAANVTSLSLSAGDWDVYGTVQYDIAGTTTSSDMTGGINTTSATLPTAGSENNTYNVTAAFGTGSSYFTCVMPRVRVSLAGTTSVYLIARATFAISTFKAFGRLTARRVR